MNWKTSLDKYLTTPPEDNFDNWGESVTSEFTDEFFDENELWIFESELCNKWLNKLFRKDYSPKRTAEIIQRAKTLYKIETK
jgi:hypothetical protein